MQLLASLQSELAQNFRLRIGVCLIALILLFYLILLQSERLQIAFDSYAQQYQRLQQAENLLAQDDGINQLDAENRDYSQLSEGLWHAETLGLAQASLQGSLGDMIKTLDLRNSRMRSGAAQPLENVDGVWQIQVQLDALYNRGDDLKLLYRLAQSSKLLVVERLDLQPSSNRLSLLVSGYFTGLENQDP
ncbi:MAG: hypothetical protein KUG75_04560 [Pseudomonadales bacterium]|nr:hypothetical protein [Pseudomonadales bacterium]